MDENIDILLQDPGLSPMATRLERLALPSIRMMSTATQENHFPLCYLQKLGKLVYNIGKRRKVNPQTLFRAGRASPLQRRRLRVFAGV